MIDVTTTLPEKPLADQKPGKPDFSVFDGPVNDAPGARKVDPVPGDSADKTRKRNKPQAPPTGPEGSPSGSQPPEGEPLSYEARLAQATELIEGYDQWYRSKTMKVWRRRMEEDQAKQLEEDLAFDPYEVEMLAKPLAKLLTIELNPWIMLGLATLTVCIPRWGMVGELEAKWAEHVKAKSPD